MAKESRREKIRADVIVAAEAWLTLNGDAPSDRERLYRSLPRHERIHIRIRCGEWSRSWLCDPQGTLVMRRFDQAKWMWLAGLQAILQRRFEDEATNTDS